MRTKRRPVRAFELEQTGENHFSISSVFVSPLHGNSYHKFLMPFAAKRYTSQNLTQFENGMVHRSSYEGVCVGHSQARIATHPSSLQGNLKPSNFLLRHNQAFTSFQGTLKPSNFFLPISRGSCWRLLISMLAFSHNLFSLSTSHHENMETQNTEVKNFGLFGEKDLLPSLSSN